MSALVFKDLLWSKPSKLGTFLNIVTEKSIKVSLLTAPKQDEGLLGRSGR